MTSKFQAKSPCAKSQKAPYIDRARDDAMRSKMDMIEFQSKHSHAILKSIFEEVGAWHVFPAFKDCDYLEMLLSTHLMRDARYKLTRFLLYNGCHPVRLAVWYKTRGMLHDHAARLDVSALLTEWKQPYNPDGKKNYKDPPLTVSRGEELPRFEREWSGTTTPPSGGFTSANGLMDDVVARAQAVLMFQSKAGGGARDRFSVPPGAHLSYLGDLGSGSARVQKAMEVYEEGRDYFNGLNHDQQLSVMHGQKPEFGPFLPSSAPPEPYDGLKWIVDLAMIPPSPPCSPPYTEDTPPASPMRDVEEDPPPIPPPPSALSFLADVSGFKADFDDRTTSLQAAVIAAQKERDGANTELIATIDILQGKAVQLGVSFDLATSADNRYCQAEKKLAEAKSALTRCFPACQVVVPMRDCLCCCLEDCPARFGPNVKASANTFLSIKSMVGAGLKRSFFTTAEAAAFSRKLASTPAPDYTEYRVHQKLDTIERAVGGMKNKFLDMKARRNGMAFESQFAFTASSAVVSRPL